VTLELTQQHSALPLAASMKQIHLTSYAQLKAQPVMPWATALPCGSEAASLPPQGPMQQVSSHMGDVGGREATTSSEGRITSPILPSLQPSSKDAP